MCGENGKMCDVRTYSWNVSHVTQPLSYHRSEIIFYALDAYVFFIFFTFLLLKYVGYDFFSIYLFGYSFGSPSCLLYIFLSFSSALPVCCLCRSSRWRKGQKNEPYFASASSFHRCDNWHTDSPFPLLHDWQATDIALFTGRNDAMPSPRWETGIRRTWSARQQQRCVHCAHTDWLNDS